MVAHARTGEVLTHRLLPEAVQVMVVSPTGRTLPETGAQSIGAGEPSVQCGAGGVVDGGAGRCARFDDYVARE